MAAVIGLVIASHSSRPAEGVRKLAEKAARAGACLALWIIVYLLYLYNSVVFNEPSRGIL